MPGETFIENHVDFERKWFRFSQFTWCVLLLLLAASASGLSGGGGPLSKRMAEAPGVSVTYERIARARSVSQLRFVVEAPAAEAKLTLRGALANQSILRDLNPQPKSVIAARDALTLVYDVQPGSAAAVRMSQAMQSAGKLRSSVEANGQTLHLEQIVLP